MREIIARPRDVQPLKRLIPGIIAGIIALVVLVGGVWSNLVADELKEMLKGPYYPVVVWGIFAIAVAVAVGSAIWAVRRPRDRTGVDETTGGVTIAGDKPRIEGDVVGRDQVGGQRAGRDITGDVAGRDQIRSQHAERDLNITNITYQGVPQPTGATSLHQIPPPPGDFTGRTAELAELKRAIGQEGAAISGLQGMGGIGKTALARKLAQELISQYPDAQIELDLKGLDAQPLSPAQAMAHVIRAYHPEALLPEGEAELGARYRSVLHGKRALLLLDNAASREQVQPLIPPQECLLLVTSRQRFHLPGLYALDLDTLPPQEARQLLLTIEPRIGGEADEIARLCGYLPLALSVAASALKVRVYLAPADYLRRLAEARELSPEVDASLSLSYALLTPELQQRWRALAVFPGPFAHPAAAAVWELELDPARDALGTLLTHSLVEWDGERQRYRLHDLARQYADARLSQEEGAAAQGRHAVHFRDILALANQLYLEGGDKVKQGLALFDLEWENVRAGQAWTAKWAWEEDHAAALCSAYPDAGVYVLYLRLHPRDWILWLEAALDAARRLKELKAEAMHLGHLGTAYRDLGEARRAIEHYQQALVIHRETGDRWGEGQALGNLGSAYTALREARRAIEHHEQALEISRETGDRRGEGQDLGDLGVAYATLGEARRAIQYYEQALAIHREVGDRLWEGATLGNLGIAYRHLGEARRAIEYYKQALVIRRETGDRRGEGEDLWNWSLALEQSGERAQAIARAEAALQILEQIEDPNAAKVREALARWRTAKPPFAARLRQRLARWRGQGESPPS